MKKLFYIFVQIFLMLLLSSCTKSNEGYSDVNRKLSGMTSYATTAEIIVKGNRTVESYSVKQYFKYPDKYRLEVISPPDKQGKVTVYDGTKLWIYQPKIKQLYIMENYKEIEESTMFPGYFAKNLFSGEQAEYSMKKDGGHNYISIKVMIPGGNRYRKWQVMYFDSESVVPVKMEMLDSDENVAVTIYYRDFLYNEKIDDKLFLMENVEYTQ